MTGESTNGVGVVETHTLTLSLPEGGFRLEEGGSLPRVDVAWESCGLVKPENDNVVFICHALTGDAHVAGRYANENESSGWWESIVGPGKAIDTNRYRVICANVLGGCKGTTGPSSVNPATGRPWGSAFPRFTIGDTVEVYRALLRELGVTHLAGLVGGSFGGIQVCEWLAAHPNEVDKAVMIASGAALNSQALAFDIVGRYAITLDPHWHGGDYYDRPFEDRPNVGLAQARQVAHITYLSLDLLNRRFGRKQQEDWLAKGAEWLEAHAAKFGTTFAIESYLRYQAKKFIARFDANSYLQITHAMDRYDASVKYGSLDEVCRRITAKLLLVSISGDWLFSEEQSRNIAAAMLRQGKDVSYSHLDIKVGHDGFLTHTKELGKLMGAFFASIPTEVASEKRQKLAPIVEMIPEGGEVLDIGCGSGSLLTLLREKKVRGTGIEIDFGKIVDGVRGDLNILYEDADEGLGLLPDAAYDVAVLSETLQTVKKPREILVKILDKAKEAVVTIPNFASIGIRLHLLLTGRMPVGSELPFEWYDTPNTHFFTFHDFRALCAKEGIEIKTVRAEANGWFGRLLLALGFVNLGADRVICRLARR
ncbi:MAG: homoserine O-acetyltransferase [bacterium]|nr:homoserine O-acetyltransferase [bacterium]